MYAFGVIDAHNPIIILLTTANGYDLKNDNEFTTNSKIENEQKQQQQ